MASKKKTAGSDLHLGQGRGKHWLVVETAYRQVLELTELTEDADLVGIFLEEMLRYHRAGGQLNNFSSHNGEFYVVTKDRGKLRVAITSRDPREPVPSMY